MPKRAPRLIFTEDEQTAPKVAKAAQKASKAADRLEKAEAKIPKKTVKKQMRVVDQKTGKVTTRLYFEEVDKKRPPSKLSHAVRDAPGVAVSSTVHRKLREADDGNSGTEAADTALGTAEGGSRIVQTAHRSHQEKPYKKADKAETAADKTNVLALNKEYAEQNGSTVNPYSKWQQKRAIKKEYAAAKAGKGASNTAKASETTAKAAKRAEEATKKTGAFIARHKKGFLIVGGIAAVLLLFSVGFSSCSVIMQSLTSSITASTYPLEDADMLAAEAAYCNAATP